MALSLKLRRRAAPLPEADVVESRLAFTEPDVMYRRAFTGSLAKSDVVHGRPVIAHVGLYDVM